MGGLRNVLAWCKRWWGVVVAAVVVALGAMLAWGAYRRKVANLQDSLEVERALRRVAELRAKREVLAAQDDADEEEIRKIDASLGENLRAIEAARLRADVPVEDMAAEFARLGYMFLLAVPIWQSLGGM